MSKDKKKEKFDDEMVELLKEEKKIKLKKRRFRADHTHTKKSGKTRLQPTDIPHVHKCSHPQCGTIVDMRPYVDDPEEGLAELKKVVAKYKNANEIIKHCAAQDVDSKKSREIVKFCADNIFGADTVVELLEAFLMQGKAKEKKEKKRKEEIAVGLDSLAFDRKGRGKKDKKW